jgi:hypothetical protein
MSEQLINLGNPPNGAGGDTSFTAFTKINANTTELYANVTASQQAASITGLRMLWTGNNSLTVQSGSAYIAPLGSILNVPADVPNTGLVLSASTWYHVYLYSNAGTAAIDISTTYPSPYYGSAAQKGADNTRRYIGSVLTDSTGKIINFLHNVQAGIVLYQTNISPASFIAVNGSATTPTSVSCSAFVPTSARVAIVTMNNNDPSVTVLLGNGTLPPSASPITFLETVGANRSLATHVPLDSSYAFQYMYLSTPTSNFVARVKGYYYER